MSGTEPDVKAAIQVPPSEWERSVTMQCSVLSENARVHNVCWFQSGPDASYPSVFAVHEDGLGGCQDDVKGQATQECDSREISSSTTGPFSCLVLTCGEVFFGNLHFRPTAILDEASIFVVVLGVFLAASIIVNACLVYILKRNSSGWSKGKFLFKESKNNKSLYFFVVFKK